MTNENSTPQSIPMPDQTWVAGDSEMTDIVTRLRNPPFGTETSERNLMSAAADEIERLHNPMPSSSLTGIEVAALFVDKRMKDYVDEFGSTDPETGSVEFPGNGDEYVSELEEIIEGIRALAINLYPETKP